MLPRWASCRAASWTARVTRRVAWPVMGEGPGTAWTADMPPLDWARFARREARARTERDRPGGSSASWKAHARDGVVGVVVARDVELGDATSEVGVQDRAGGVVVAGANVAGEVTRDALRAVAAFLKDLVHEDVLPRLRRGDVREEHHGARRDRGLCVAACC